MLVDWNHENPVLRRLCSFDLLQGFEVLDDHRQDIVEHVHRNEVHDLLARSSFRAGAAAHKDADRVDNFVADPRLCALKANVRRLVVAATRRTAKGDGDSPVQAYIAAMPEWKSDVGRRLDELIVRAVPGVRKAVRWNLPFYGVEGQGWFVSYHVFTKYIKVTFLNDASLEPAPPGSGKDKDARWINIYEGELDEAQMAEWVRQSAAILGRDGF